MNFDRFLSRIQLYTPNLIAYGTAGTFAIFSGLLTALNLKTFAQMASNVSQGIGKGIAERDAQHRINIDKADARHEKLNEKIAKADIDATQQKMDAQVGLQQAKYHMAEMRTKQETKLMDLLTEHLNVETQNKQALQEAAQTTSTATTANVSVTEKAAAAVQNLTQALTHVDKAHKELNDALRAYELHSKQSNLDEEMAKKVQHANIKVMQAESELLTTLKISDIENKSELEQKFQKALHKEQQKTDKLVSSLDIDAVKQLADVTREEIKSEKQYINRQLADAMKEGKNTSETDLTSNIKSYEQLLEKLDSQIQAKDDLRDMHQQSAQSR